MSTGIKISCPSSPGRVASSSSTTGATDENVEPSNATSIRDGVSAHLFSGTFCSTNEREREHPVHVRGQALEETGR